MRTAVSITLSFRALLLGVLVVLFSVGCSKHEDDCSAPENNDEQATTRSAEAGDETAKGKLPAGKSIRGAGAGDGDHDGDGINDDGDDEADGEGNKKGRVQH